MITENRIAVYDAQPTVTRIPADAPITFIALSDVATSYSDFAYIVNIIINGTSAIKYKLAPRAEYGNRCVIDVSRFVKNYIDVNIAFPLTYEQKPHCTLKVGVQEFYNKTLQGSEIYTSVYYLFRSITDKGMYDTSEYLPYIDDAHASPLMHLSDVRYDYIYSKKDCFTAFYDSTSGANAVITFYDALMVPISSIPIPLITGGSNIHQINFGGIFTPTNTKYIGVTSDSGKVEERIFEALTQVCNEEIYMLHFLNSFGVLESFPFRLSKRYMIDTSTSNIRKQRVRYNILNNNYDDVGEITVEKKRRVAYRLRSGWVNHKYFNFLQRVLSYSPLIYLSSYEEGVKRERVILRDYSIQQREVDDEYLVELSLDLEAVNSGNFYAL